jgi:hypothetical protein
MAGITYSLSMIKNLFFKGIAFTKTNGLSIFKQQSFAVRLKVIMQLNSACFA